MRIYIGKPVVGLLGNDCRKKKEKEEKIMSTYPFRNLEFENTNNCGNCRYHLRSGAEWEQAGGPYYICTNEYSKYYGAETPYSFGCVDYEDKEGS